MIHESETPNSNSALYHTFTLFYAAHWPTSSKLGQAPSQLNQEPFDISCNTLSHKATYSKSVSSQLWWTETITYELHEYGITQEFTS